MTVYLLHFDRPLAHARHYIGSTDDLDKRLQRHRAGQGARLLEVLKERGIGWQCVCTWEGGRDLERKLKKHKKAWRHCPICSLARKP